MQRSQPVATSRQNVQGPQTSSAQIQREIIVKIRDPVTIQSLRAMNPRNLKTYVERAVAQSDNENIINAKITSANQLKSGDLGIKTATHSQMQALRQFADDWAYRLGHGASIRNPTFGFWSMASVRIDNAPPGQADLPPLLSIRRERRSSPSVLLH